MDVINHLSTSQPIQVLDMHTTGEPTRIILSGYPHLSGTTLLAQRADALAHHDHIRRRLLLEPRGHRDMYGVLLRPDTELVRSGAAHVGVLFLTNDGYSTMCGHATIALGRFLLDTIDTQVFPARVARLGLHAPCGLVEVEVPVVERGGGGWMSDPERAVSFVCVPSFATAIAAEIEVPEAMRWPELKRAGREKVVADFSYGGAFYCLVEAREMGFEDGLGKVDLDAMNRASRLLKEAIVTNPKYRHAYAHPEHGDLSFLYSIMFVDRDLGRHSEGSDGAETGLCFFSDQQLDRSPTGSAVAARDALAVARRERTLGQRWTYHSLVSNATNGKGGFDSEVVDIRTRDSLPTLVWVKVSGFAYYSGTSTFFVEKADVLGDGGFLFDRLAV